MTDESTIFTSEDHGSEGTQAPAISIPDSVKEMIGEGRKYATVEKALEALGHSQAHIQRIEQENRQLREQSQPGVTQEEVLQTVREMLAAERTTSGAAPASVDESLLDTLLDRKLAAKREAEIAAANVEVVKKAMLEKFGAEKAEGEYRKAAEGAGIGTETLNSLAAKSPQAAFKLLGLEWRPNAGTVTKGTVNSSALSHQAQPEPQRKSVMRGASTQDMIAEWKRHDPRNKQE